MHLGKTPTDSQTLSDICRENRQLDIYLSDEIDLAYAHAELFDWLSRFGAGRLEEVAPVLSRRFKLALIGFYSLRDAAREQGLLNYWHRRNQQRVNYLAYFGLTPESVVKVRLAEGLVKGVIAQIRPPDTRWDESANEEEEDSNEGEDGPSRMRLIIHRNQGEEDVRVTVAVKGNLLVSVEKCPESGESMHIERVPYYLQSHPVLLDEWTGVRIQGFVSAEKTGNSKEVKRLRALAAELLFRPVRFEDSAPADEDDDDESVDFGPFSRRTNAYAPKLNVQVTVEPDKLRMDMLGLAQTLVEEAGKMRKFSEFTLVEPDSY